MIFQEQIFNARILIVDDQKLHALFLKEVLGQAGYKNVSYLTDPFKVFPAVQEICPDLIVLDIMMPRLDGFQVMEKLHEFREGHYLPILALSAEKSSEVRLKALQIGANDFVSKPYENPEILIRIRNIVEMRILHMIVEDQNKILEARVQERTKELRESQLDVIRRLAQAAEFRDNNTGIHIIRMSQYCVRFAEALGLSEAECELLLYASPLHDVGKIGIPDSILLKPGPLTTEEYEIMKTHTTLGAKLLSGSNSPMMKMAQTIALTHHEKWDGTGYPQKLKGDDIPLIGQITGLCDVFDALTSDRPYKKAWTTEAALEELVRLKGKQFNPVLVDRFIEVFPYIENIKVKGSNTQG